MSNANDFIVKDGVLKRYTGSASVVTIPENVEQIGKDAFYGCHEIEQIVIPAGVKYIGENAFRECTHLKSIAFPDGLEYIGDCAFFLCGLNSIAFPNSVVEIGNAAFGMTHIEKIVIPESIKKIGTRAFEVVRSTADKPLNVEIQILGNEIVLGLKVFPDSLSISFYAPNVPLSCFPAENKRQIVYSYLLNNVDQTFSFEEDYKKYINKTDDFIGLLIQNNDVVALSKLLQFKTKVKLEKLDSFIAQAEGMAEIEALLLEYKSKIFLLENIEKMEERKADLALGIKDRTPAEWQKIYDFEKTEKGITITSYKGDETIVEVPAAIANCQVIAIGDEAFSPFKARIKNVQTRMKIKELILPGSLKAIGKNAFKSCVSLESIVIPDSVSKIGAGAFSDCKNLVKATVSGKVKKIGMIFNGCKQLQEVTLRKGTTCIDMLAFFGFQNLAVIHIPASVTSIEKTALRNCSKVAIYAPAGSYAETYAKENNIPFVAE